METNLVYAYQVDRDSWSKFIGLDIRHADIVVGTQQRDNVNLLVGSDNVVTEFPGTALTTKDVIVKTKRFALLGQKIRRVCLDYEGINDPVLTVIAYNRRFASGVQTYEITIDEPNKWYGLPTGFKCEQVQFMITGCQLVKYIRYTTA